MTPRFRRRTQQGHIAIESGCWILRYRVTEEKHGQEKRVQKFVNLAPADGKLRPKYDAGGKLQIPAKIRDMRDDILKPLNTAALQMQDLTVWTVEGFAQDKYFPKISQPWPQGKKPSTVKGYRDIFRVHIKPRIGKRTLHEFRRVHAADLYEEIRVANPELTHRTFKIFVGSCRRCLPMRWTGDITKAKTRHTPSSRTVSLSLRATLARIRWPRWTGLFLCCQIRATR
jgi:hypothetical protein